ncbi:MAG: hypothetical protein HY323_05600 [Betaproteobacteria bacterium]|nr:hypothetical protein [Betaproteobacteria bacterium]
MARLEPFQDTSQPCRLCRTGSVQTMLKALTAAKGMRRRERIVVCPLCDATDQWPQR